MSEGDKNQQPETEGAKASARPPAPSKAKAVEEPRRVPTLTMDRFHLKDGKNPGLWLCVPKDTHVEDLLVPEFWANFAASGKIQPCFTVEVHWDDRSQFAELYVLNHGRNWASMSLMRHVPLSGAVRQSEGEHFRVEYNGPVEQHRIINLKTGTVLRSGFGTKLEADRFLADHLRKLPA